MSKTKSSWEATYAKRSHDLNSHTWCPEKEHANQSCVVRASSSSYKTRSCSSFYFPPLYCSNSSRYLKDNAEASMLCMALSLSKIDGADLMSIVPRPLRTHSIPTRKADGHRTYAPKCQSRSINPRLRLSLSRDFSYYPRSSCILQNTVTKGYVVRDCCESSKVTFTTTHEKRLFDSDLYTEHQQSNCRTREYVSGSSWK